MKKTALHIAAAAAFMLGLLVATSDNVWMQLSSVALFAVTAYVFITDDKNEHQTNNA